MNGYSLRKPNEYEEPSEPVKRNCVFSRRSVGGRVPGVFRKVFGGCWFIGYRCPLCLPAVGESGRFYRMEITETGKRANCQGGGEFIPGWDGDAFQCLFVLVRDSD